MESEIWDKLTQVQMYFESALSETGNVVHDPRLDKFNRPGWTHVEWHSKDYLRSNISIIDARETRKIWMMHCCIFPNLDNPAPIFGFDVIAGKSKITGCFYDFSPTVDPNHPLCEWWDHETDRLIWKKERDLPPWAKAIFSKNMIAAGFVSEPNEVDQIVEIAQEGIDTYLKCVAETAGQCESNLEAQNLYCGNQRQNPHNKRVMMNLGLSEEDAELFVNGCLFPTIE